MRTADGLVIFEVKEWMPQAFISFVFNCPPAFAMPNNQKLNGYTVDHVPLHNSYSYTRYCTFTSVSYEYVYNVSMVTSAKNVKNKMNYCATDR